MLKIISDFAASKSVSTDKDSIIKEVDSGNSEVNKNVVEVIVVNKVNIETF